MRAAKAAGDRKRVRPKVFRIKVRTEGASSNQSSSTSWRGLCTCSIYILTGSHTLTGTYVFHAALLFMPLLS